MSRVGRFRGQRWAFALTLSCVLGLSACSSEPSASPPPSPSSPSSESVTPVPSLPPSQSPKPEPYLPVPQGVTLTEPGWALQVGERATVAWELPAARGKAAKSKAKPKIAVVQLTILAMEAATLKEFTGWQLNKAARQSNPFFIRALVRNVGKTDLSGQRLPVYIVDGRNTLIQASTFEGDFKPCGSHPLPARFKPKAKAKLCTVYLAPDDGRLTAVSFRPTRKFVPITWTGALTPYVADKGKKSKKSG